MQLHHHTLIATALFTGSALAAELPAEGKFDFTACWSGVSNAIAFSKTHAAYTYDMTGSSRASQPGAMFDKSSFHCIGLNTNFDGKSSGTAVCEAVDKDGDKTFTKFDVTSGKAVRTHLGGTGKYEGSAIVGTAEPLGPFPTIKAGTFQGCNHQTGTYKLPKLMK